MAVKAMQAASVIAWPCFVAMGLWPAIYLEATLKSQGANNELHQKEQQREERPWQQPQLQHQQPQLQHQQLEERPWQIRPPPVPEPSAPEHPPFQWPCNQGADISIMQPFKSLLPNTMQYNPAASRYCPKAPTGVVPSLQVVNPGNEQLFSQVIASAVTAAFAAGRSGSSGDGGDLALGWKAFDGQEKQGKAQSVTRPFPVLSSVASMKQLWSLWDKGDDLRGSRAFRVLEEEGTGWRQGHRKGWFEWNRALTAIREIAAAEGQPPEVIAARLEELRLQTDTPMSSFCKDLGKRWRARQKQAAAGGVGTQGEGGRAKQQQQQEEAEGREAAGAGSAGGCKGRKRTKEGEVGVVNCKRRSEGTSQHEEASRQQEKGQEDEEGGGARKGRRQGNGVTRHIAQRGSNMWPTLIGEVGGPNIHRLEIPKGTGSQGLGDVYAEFEAELREAKVNRR